MNKLNIEKADIPIIKKKILEFLKPVFPTPTLDIFVVTRIDFCYNLKMSYEERRCLFDLLNKSSGKVYHLKKTSIYKMGNYLHNKSRTFQIYDKIDKWLSTNGKQIRYFELDIVRVELQLRARALKATKLPRDFDTWVNTDMENHYLESIRKFIPKADYWSREVALKMINESAYSPLIKKRLIKYIDDVAATNMDTVYNAGCDDTINGYIKRLVAINVNPVTIDARWGIEHLKTPIR